MAESFLTEHGLGWILVIAGVVVLGLIFLVTIVPNLNIFDILSKLVVGEGTPPATEALVLQNALQCSYYRCVKGCNSDEVKRLKYSSTENTFDCSEFCKPGDDKVCDDKAKANPVVAKVVAKGGEKISLDKLKFAKCIIETDKCELSKGLSQIVFIQKDFIKENTETKVGCNFGQSFGLPAISAAIIREDSYKIWTSSVDWGANGGATFVCST